MTKTIEKNLAKGSCAAFIALFALCVATGLNIEWLSWFFGLASGVSLWQLIFKR